MCLNIFCKINFSLYPCRVKVFFAPKEGPKAQKLINNKLDVIDIIIYN